MVSMCSALRQIKDDPFAVLQPDTIAQACARAGHVWRPGPLDPVHTVALFVQQVAAGNVSCAAVRHWSPQPFTASAYCQARQRLPRAVLEDLAGQVAAGLDGSAAAGAAPARASHWHGHRVWIVDGSSFSMPDTPALQAHFGQPTGQRAGCGFPVAHLLTLFDLASGMLREPVASPLYTSDLRHVDQMHAQMGAGDLVLGDDYFCNYGHAALLQRRGQHLLVPNHHRRIVSFRPHRRHTHPRHKPLVKGRPRSRWLARLGPGDQLVEWFKPVEVPAWLTPAQYAQLPDSLVVREVRRTVRRPGFRPVVVTLVTTLLDSQAYPADELVALRWRRWEVETDLGHLKTTLGLSVLKCQSVEGVGKELAVFVLVYNLVRAVMREAARRQGTTPQRISFADTLAWLRVAGPEDPLPALVVVPRRPDRVEPRARKRRPKSYPSLTQPRATLRKRLKNKGKTR